MFNWLSLVKPVGILLVVLSIAGAGAYANGVRWEAKYDKLQASYDTFKGGVAALGEAAKAKNAQIALDNLKAKERADEQNRLEHARDVATITRMRRDADSARRSALPSAPAGSSRPDLICLDRAEYQRTDGEAVSRLRAGARGLADEGAAATVDLNTAKVWAAEVHLKLSTPLKGATP